MQRTSKTTQLGTAFFLCLSLAVVPFSLRVAGVQLTLSPRFAAAMEVWGQISEAFGASYQQSVSSLPEVAAVSSPDAEPLNSSHDCGAHDESACASGAGEPAAFSPSTNGAHPRVTTAARRTCPKLARREAEDRSPVRLDPGQLSAVARAIQDAVNAQSISFERLRNIKVQATEQREWLDALEKQLQLRNRELQVRTKGREIPRKLRVLVQMKSPVASTSAAECKVRAAMASVRRLELQRAGLIDDQPASADHCEL